MIQLGRKWKIAWGIRWKLKNMNSDSSPKVIAPWITLKENQNSTFPSACTWAVSLYFLSLFPNIFQLMMTCIILYYCYMPDMRVIFLWYLLYFNNVVNQCKLSAQHTLTRYYPKLQVILLSHFTEGSIWTWIFFSKTLLTSCISIMKYYNALPNTTKTHCMVTNHCNNVIIVL